MSDIKEDTKTLEEILAEFEIQEVSKLVLWNDSNTFEWVIFCLTTIVYLMKLINT